MAVGDGTGKIAVFARLCPSVVVVGDSLDSVFVNVFLPPKRIWLFLSPADLLWTGLEGVIQQRSGLPHTESKQVPEKRCECQSPELKSCVCCLRMSLPFLDLTTSPGESPTYRV